MATRITLQINMSPSELQPHLEGLKAIAAEVFGLTPADVEATIRQEPVVVDAPQQYPTYDHSLRIEDFSQFSLE